MEVKFVFFRNLSAKCEKWLTSKLPIKELKDIR